MDGQSQWWNGRILALVVVSGTVGALFGVVTALSVDENDADFLFANVAGISVLLVPAVAAAAALAFPKHPAAATRGAGFAQYMASFAFAWGFALTLLAPEDVEALNWRTVSFLIGAAAATSAGLAVVSAAIAYGVTSISARPHTISPLDDGRSSPASASRGPGERLARGPLPPPSAEALAALDARLADGTLNPEDYRERRALILNRD